MTKFRALTIACFGEALWDVLPRGIFLGGAPLNVAYHLSRQGVRPWMLSAVGRDFLGDEILRRVAAWDMSTRFIARHPRLPTGTVRATLDGRGAATFNIARHVAWDAIEVSTSLPRRPGPAAIVFGSLALRETSNRRALAKVFARWPEAWRVLDLNLRAPFDGAAVITHALSEAQVLKLNDAELGRLTGSVLRSVPILEKAARQVAARHALPRICVTAGAHGAGLLWDGSWHWEAARPVTVRDTVGAGDAFLATFLASLLARGATPQDALANACRVGEFVATQDGGTPHYRVDRRGRPVGVRL